MKPSLSDAWCSWARPGILVLVGIAASAAVLLAPAPVRGQEDVAAHECCLALLFPVSARSVALGRAVVARPGPEAVFGNPAGLARLDTSQVVIHHTTILEAEQANAVSLIFAGGGIGTVGLSYQLLDYGEQTANTGGGQTGSLATREHFLVASYASGVVGGVSAGINYKLYQFRLDCSGFCGGDGGAATTHVLDLGVQYHPGWLPLLQLGAAVTDVGFSLQVVNAEQADRPPTRLRVGGAYDVLSAVRPDSIMSVWVSGEVEHSVFATSATRVGAGVEFALQNLVFLRAGYRSGEGLGSGPAVGMGLHYDRFNIGLAKSFYQSPLGDSPPVQITFGVVF